MRRPFWALAAALAQAIVPAAAAPRVAGKPFPMWAPDRALLGQLGPEITRPGFRLRPPKGYLLQEQSAGTTARYAWVGAARPDGTSPTLTLLVATPPPGETRRYTAPQALDKFLAGVQSRRDAWHRSATERGRVGGLEFARARWSGVEPNTRRAMRGFIYAAVRGRQVVQIASQDVAPAAAASLKLAEAAALTFRGR
jgi:hypothetical protein